MKKLLCWIGWHSWKEYVIRELAREPMLMERYSRCPKVRPVFAKTVNETLSSAFSAQARESIGSTKVASNKALLAQLKHLHEVDPDLLYTGLRDLTERDGLTFSNREFMRLVTDECSKLVESRMTGASSK